MHKYTNNYNMFTKLQQKAYNHIMNGKNVFITGGGGVGKSFLIQKYIQNNKHSNYIGVTSLTGTSAILIKGSTLHSFLGIGLGKKPVQVLAQKILKKSYLKKRWKQIQVLIIDEVSMLSCELFEKIEKLARLIRDIYEPFGGIQLICSGDFCQLPVIGSTQFCFESKVWDDCIDETVYLTEIVRQKDKQFVNVLNNIRLGNITENVKKVLNERVGVKLQTKNGIRPTRLFCLNKDVNSTNTKKLMKIIKKQETELKTYTLTKTITLKKNKFSVDKCIRQLPVNIELKLTKNAQVMLVYNLNIKEGMVNGARGVVTDFNQDGLPYVKFMNGKEQLIDYHIWDFEEDNKSIGTAKQIPLRLAYASTIHKLQGSTIDYSNLYLKDVFEYGMAYVALSRVRSLDGLSIKSINYAQIKAHPKAVEYYKKLTENQK